MASRSPRAAGPGGQAAWEEGDREVEVIGALTGGCNLDKIYLGLRNKLSEARAEADGLGSQLTARSKAAAELRSLQSDVREAEAVAKRELEARAARLQELRKELASLRERERAKQKELRDVEAAARASRAEMEADEGRLKQMARAREASEKELARLQKNVGEGQRELAADRARLRAARQTANLARQARTEKLGSLLSAIDTSISLLPPPAPRDSPPV